MQEELFYLISDFLFDDGVTTGLLMTHAALPHMVNEPHYNTEITFFSELNGCDGNATQLAILPIS